MTTVLMCASPIYGHVPPMITIGRDLVSRGHRVRMLTGSRFAAAVSAAGIEHVSLPPGCDYDDSGLEAAFPGGETLTGVRRLRFDVEHTFIGTMSEQYAAVAAELAGDGADVVLSETAFLGVAPLLLQPRSSRPAVLVCGVLPLTLSSRDTAPFGLGLPPSASLLGRVRNRLLNALVSRVIFGRAQRLAQAQLRALDVPPLPCLVLDTPGLADHLLQLTVPGFEYPRSDQPGSVRCIGPVLPPSSDFSPPDWWGQLDEARQVVHVTQGTIANDDLDQLVNPTLQALTDEDVLVVVTTGDEERAGLLAGAAPANVRVAAFIPYDRLLDKVDVMVTNGGYGGVHFALAHGVPLVVAGATEEKPEVAARVAWSGAGINLKTGTPGPDQLRAAVRRLLDEPSYRLAAQRLQREIAQATPLDDLDAVITQEVGVRVHSG